MTLDELIADLVALRKKSPQAAEAEVYASSGSNAVHVGAASYNKKHGTVSLAEDEEF